MTLEEQLRDQMERGPEITEVKYLVIHCSATRCTQSYPVEQLLRDHRKRGFRTIGYHFYIRRDGTLTQHRALLATAPASTPPRSTKGYKRFSPHPRFGLAGGGAKFRYKGFGKATQSPSILSALSHNSAREGPPYWRPPWRRRKQIPILPLRWEFFYAFSHPAA
jgi:hypothetical protein